MGRSWVSAIGRVRLVTISAAVALVLAGLTLRGSGSTGGATFRDLAYGPQPGHSHRVKLTGVVTGVKTPRSGFGGEKAAVISVRQRTHKKGTLLASTQPNCGGVICQVQAQASLSVGPVKSKTHFYLTFKSAGCGLNGCSSPAKFGQGVLTSGQRAETLRVNVGRIPTTRGSKFGIVLTY